MEINENYIYIYILTSKRCWNVKNIEKELKVLIILYNSDNFDYFLENDINKNLNYLCCFQANKLNISS